MIFGVMFPMRVTYSHLQAVDALARRAQSNRSAVVRRLIEVEADKQGVWPSAGDNDGGNRDKRGEKLKPRESKPPGGDQAGLGI